MATAADIADAYWARVFEGADAEPWPTGVHLTFADDGWDGVYVMRVGASVRVRAPRRTRDVVEPLVRAAPAERLLGRAMWLDGLADLGPTVLGPASHFVADAPVGGAGDGDRERAHAIDAAQAAAFAAHLAADEVEEAGILEDGAQHFGVSADGRLAAVSALTDWAGAPSDVGVITAPRRRGRGLGRIAAAPAIDHAVSQAGFARWRSRDDNPASIAIARRLGLAFYGTNLGIRLR